MVNIWGSGTPRREFLHVDDMAAASIFVMELPRETLQAHTRPMMSHINVGSGQEVTIREAAGMVAEAVGYRGSIECDSSKPDGTPRKLLDTSLLARLGWRAGIGLAQGLADTYRHFLKDEQARQDAPAAPTAAAVATSG